MKARKIVILVLVSVFAFALIGSPKQVVAQIEPFFTISACPICHWITLPSGSDKVGLQVDLTIEDLNGEIIFSGTDFVEQKRPDFAAASFDIPNIELLPGFVVTASVPNTNYSKTLIVSQLDMTSWDLAADTVSGVTEPGKEVHVHVMTPHGGVSSVVTASSTGAWTTSFFWQDPDLGIWTNVDLDLGTNGGVFVPDENNNNTWMDWGIPGPNLAVRADFGDAVLARAWPTGAVITLTVDNPATTLNPDYSGSMTVTGENTFHSETYTEFDLTNIFDIQPGFVVKVTDGTYTRTHTVTSLHFTNWNIGTMNSNILTGVAIPGNRVEIWACSTPCDNPVRRSVVADDFGNWTADFNSIGGAPGFDLTYGTWVDSEEMDGSGQKTMYGRLIPFQPPVAEAGSNFRAKEGTPFSLDASGSYSYFGDPLTYTWDLDGDGIYDDASGVSPTLVFPDEVIKIFGLKVTDPFEWSATDTVQVTVVNVVPSISPLKIILGQNGNISGSGFFTDPGADFPWTGTINLGDGPGPIPMTLNSDKTFSFMHKYYVYGNYRILVCITDNDGGTGCSPTQFKVYNNRAPIAEAAGPYQGNEGSRITLDAKYSVGQDDNIILYEWDLDNDGQFDDAAGVKTYFTAMDNGTYTVRVRVTDAGNLSSIDDAKVNVNNMPPVISSVSAKNSIQVGQSYNSEVKFSDPGVNDTFTAVWDWGDHTSTTLDGIVGQNPLIKTHVYTYAGVFTVTVTITDNSGAKAVSTRPVTVLRVK